MNWKKQKPIRKKDTDGKELTSFITAPMNMLIATGFGSAFATKDNEKIYDENNITGNDYWKVSDVEKLAIKDPGHDWQIHKRAPLYGMVFQRHGLDNWVCIEANKGFA